jgi:hypothetical protein
MLPCMGKTGHNRSFPAKEKGDPKAADLFN